MVTRLSRWVGLLGGRAAPRARQRGAAVFIVLLVLTVLTGIGGFAMQSAGLNQRTSGYNRQATQTAYVAEYGLLAALDEISYGGQGMGDMASQYFTQMMAGQETCVANQYIDAGAEGGLPCYRLYSFDIQNRLTQANNGAELFDIDGGSLGPGPQYVAGKQPGAAQGDFVVELSDEPIPAGPIAGYDQGGVGPKQKWVLITVSGMGNVKPRTATANCQNPEDQYSVHASGTKTTRARVKLRVTQ
jgi:hypothetical protein